MKTELERLRESVKAYRSTLARISAVIEDLNNFEKCENCDCILSVDDLKYDNDGVPLCRSCFEEMQTEHQEEMKRCYE